MNADRNPKSPKQSAHEHEPAIDEFLEGVRAVRSTQPTAQIRLSELQFILLSISRYARMLRDIDHVQDNHLDNILSRLSCQISKLAEREDVQANITYSEVVAEIEAACRLADFDPGPAQGKVLFAPIPFAPLPYLALGAGQLATEDMMSPEEIEAFLKDLEAFLRSFWNEMNATQRDRIKDLFLAVFSAIAAIRDAIKSGASREVIRLALEKLAEALANFIRMVATWGGDIATWFYSRLIPVLLRLTGLLGEGGAAAGGATGGFVLVDLLIVIVLLALWALLWVKIGTWFWNRKIGGSSQTYVDFWGNKFYEFYRGLAGHSCEDMLDEWISADRDVRSAEASGASLTDLMLASTHAWALAKTLLERCPDLSIIPVLRRRVQHYNEIRQQWENWIENR
jgi:hypothetical protein